VQSVLSLEMECNPTTGNRTRFVYQPHTWIPANSNWNEYDVNNAEILRNVNALETLRVMHRNNPKSVPTVPSRQSVFQYNFENESPGILVIDFARVSLPNDTIWNNVMAALVNQTVNNIFACTWSKLGAEQKTTRYGKAHAIFLGQRVERVQDRSNKCIPELKPADTHAQLSFEANSCQIKHLIPAPGEELNIFGAYSDPAAVLFPFARIFEIFLQQCHWHDFRNRCYHASCLGREEYVTADEKERPYYAGIWEIDRPLFLVRPDRVICHSDLLPSSTLPLHVLIRPKVKQGFANRVCTITNGMLLASYLQWGVIIVWEKSEWCPCDLTDCFDVSPLRRHDELKFVKVYDCIEEYTAYHAEETCILIEHFSMPIGFSAEFHRILLHPEDEPVKWYPRNALPSHSDFTSHILNALHSKFLRHARQWKTQQEAKFAVLHPNIWNWKWAGFHVRRGDMAAMQWIHNSYGYADDDNDLYYRIRNLLLGGYLVYIALDDPVYYRKLREWFPPDSELGQHIVYHSSHQLEWHTELTNPKPELRATSTDTFLEDLSFLSLCDVVHAQQSSTVKAILRAICPNAQYSEIGKIFKAMIKPPAAAHHELMNIVTKNYDKFRQAQIYRIPHFQLREELINLLAGLPVEDLLEVYQDMVLEMNRSRWGKFCQMRLMAFVSRRNERVRLTQEAYDNAALVFQKNKCHWLKVKADPGFLTALIWTRLRHLHQGMNNKCFVCAGDFVWLENLDNIPLVEWWLTDFYSRGSMRDCQHTAANLQITFVDKRAELIARFHRFLKEQRPAAGSNIFV